VSDRWVLNRAGILNVYQYGDEVLHFAGGRLLLRGVNGSGKSTAMNMLLPFLLDADTRRIDAAGVQQGVLRSWMLTGRDEPQPVGYLWLEVARAEEHLVFGCGIRANRSTDNVATWWFITDRRPHVDVNLVEGRTPRSVDSLRAVLGAGSSVFTRDQRNSYRAELRRRLFGGADLDQHIRLLHVLRSPTVGDRIDTDLARYLDEALPQLSEQAIDDAAQPLEDLEEHRRNVTQLTATDETVQALAVAYGGYARSQLRAAAHQAHHDAEEVRRRRHHHDRLERDADAAQRTLADARQTVSALDADVERLSAEVRALKEQPLYQEGQALEDLRSLVQVLDAAASRADDQLARATERREALANEEERAAALARDDHTAVVRQLGELRSALALHRVDAVVADLASIDVAPGAPPPTEVGHAVLRELGGVTARIAQRRADVGTVRQHLDAVDRAERALEQARAVTSRAGAELAAAEAELTGAEAVSIAAVAQWRAELERWTDDAAAFAGRPGSEVVAPPAIAPDADVRGDRAELRDRARAWARSVQQLLETAVARADETVRGAAAREAEARATLDELLDRSEPDPPSMPWQASTEEPRLGALVDFGDDVPAADRLGLESALEASGLLAATVRDSTLELATGDLIAIPTVPVARPLSDVLVVTEPEPGADPDLADRVRAVLGAISVDVDGGAPTAVGPDGRFRVGSLTGRHRREQVELIGVTARRAALDRRRDAARVDLEAAQGHHRAARAERDRWLDRRGAVTELADRLPPTASIDRALLAEDAAADLVEQRAAALGRLADEAATAEQDRDQREDDLRRQAATLGLPRLDAELRAIEGDLDQARQQLAVLRSHLATLDRSLEAWAEAHARSVAADGDLRQAGEAHGEAVAAHASEAARLATLEDALGVDYQLLLDSLERAEGELREATRALPGAHAAVEHQVEAAARARAAADAAGQSVEAAEAEVVGHLDHLRAVLAVPGLSLVALGAGLANESTSTDHLAGAERTVDLTDPGGPNPSDPGGDAVTATSGPSTPPAVERSSAGVSALARWLLERTHAPAVEVTAESLRMSLRQRRNALGAGWDAEDRQPDPALPVWVEVNGPEGRFTLPEAAQVVADRLHQQRSLLDAKQTQALRNLLQGLIAKEIAVKLGAARDLVGHMNDRLALVETAHGIRVSLKWARRDDLDDELGGMIDLLARPPDLRTPDDDERLIAHISRRIDDARAEEPEAPYRDLIAAVLDYRRWHEMRLMLHRPGQAPQRLGRRTALSEGEKKVVSYLPLFAAVAASCDALAEHEPAAPRFVLLDDAFAKVSADNHEKLFGLLVEMDLDFIATSERLWGTHASVPELAITEVVRDAEAGVILLEHARWDGDALVGNHG
jgi:hypothetical protein